MKERPVQKVEAGCGAASAALRCAGLRSATAALRSNCSSVSGAKGLQEGVGKSAGEWHFTLGGKIDVDTNELSPKEATQMSAIYRHLLILCDVWPLFEDCGGKITVRLGFRCGAQFIRLGGISLSEINLSVPQQQLCKIVCGETVVVRMGKCLFCVLDFAASVPFGVGKNSGMTA